MRYKYTAMDATGREHSGFLEAENNEEGYNIIRKKGMFVCTLYYSPEGRSETPKKKSPAIYILKICGMILISPLVFVVGGCLNVADSLNTKYWD